MLQGERLLLGDGEVPANRKEPDLVGVDGGHAAMSPMYLEGLGGVLRPA